MKQVALALSLFASSAFGYIAPLLTQRETIDRVVDGVEERSYLVRFNEKAPEFEFQAKDKLMSWLPTVMPEVNPEGVQHVYNIDETFRGFAVWAKYEALQSILAYEGVHYVEEDQVMRATAFTDRPDWGQVRSAQRARNLATNSAQYNYTGTTYPSASLSDATWNWTAAVWNTYRPINQGASVRIWIVDTGVYQTHQEFQVSGRSRVTANQDYVTPSTGGTDCNGHGTHCAGSAAGLYRGLAKNADIGNVRVLGCQGSGTNANVVAGFNYVANNKGTGRGDILSASLGGGASQTTDDAITANANRGVIPVVAAGNDNGNACLSSPARAAAAVTVGATQSSDARATFSNFGPCVNVFAPGVSIHSGWYTSATTYNTISGTSMATPLVAGAIALYITQQGTGTTPAQVNNAITTYGVRNVVTNPGTGSPNIFIYANWASA